MCDICRHTPCAPRCPNAPDPPEGPKCACCDDEAQYIYMGYGLCKKCLCVAIFGDCCEEDMEDYVRDEQLEDFAIWMMDTERATVQEIEP